MHLAAVDKRSFECLARRDAGRSAMEEQWFDTVVKHLGQWGGSRRRALQAAAVLAGAGLPALLPETGTAGARKRCRRNGGHYLSKGTCNCAPTCSGNDPDRFHCRSDNCTCFETVERTGFCMLIAGSITEAGCHTSAECEDQTRRCVMTGFPTPTICTACPCSATQACIDGVCRNTHCVAPCPEGG
jgi:hypothetical protein